MRANRYVSYLAAEIEPRALAEMNRFEREAEKTMQRIASAGSKGSAGFASSAMGLGFKRGADQVVASGTRIRKELTAVERAQQRVGTGATIMSASFGRAADALQIVQGPLGPLAGRLSALGQVLRSLTGFTLAGVLAGGGAFALGGIATQYQKVHDTLVPLYDDQKSFNQAMSDVIGIAQRSRQALEPVAQLYGQIGRVAKDAGISQERAARLTETVAKASRIGGGDPAAQQAAIVQFGQALSANFRGSSQELQSILEQTPVLAQAIAKGLGVKASQLKQLAKDSKLSTDLVIQGLEREANEIDTRFGQIPKRIGSSITDLSNSLSIFIGRMDETTGATTGVANAISFLAGNLGNVTAVLGTVAVAFAANTFAGAVQGIAAYVGRLAAIAPLTREQILTNELFKRSIQERAATEVQEAEVAVASAKSYQEQIRANIVMIERQIAAQARALEMARTLDAALRTSGGTGSSQVLTASYEELNASERALIATQNQLIASDAELAAAEARLAVGTEALAVADEQLVVAETAAAASSGRLASAKFVLQGAMSRVQGAAMSLVGFLGGGWGVAFTAAAGWAMYLATRTDEAKAAVDRFRGGEDALAQRMGITTAQIRDQTSAVQQLTLAMLRSKIAEAQVKQKDVGAQLAGDLAAASDRGLWRGMSARDLHNLQSLSTLAERGQFDWKKHGAVLADIQQRNPSAFQQGLLSRMLGNDPSRAISDIQGVASATFQLEDATKALADAQKELAKPAPLVKVGGKPVTTADLNAQARVAAARSGLDKARADLALAKTQGPNEGETNDQYVQRIAGLIQNVNNLVEAHKAAARAKAEERHQQALLNKEMVRQESIRDKMDQLAGIQNQYTADSPVKRIEQINDAATAAKAKIKDLIDDLVRLGSLTPAQGRAELARRQDVVTQGAADEIRRPVQESIDAANQELTVQRLISQGLGDQAEFVARKYELEKKVGELLPDEVQQIRDQISEAHRLNDVLDKRNAIIENNAQFLDSFKDALQGSIKSILSGDIKGGIKSFFKNVQAAYLNAKANEIVMKLIGDPGKKYRDEMTRGLNNSAENLTGSAGDLTKSADALDKAANALSTAATAASPAGPGGGLNGAAEAIGQAVADPLAAIADSVAPRPAANVADPNAIIITGTRKKIKMPAGIDSVFKDALGSLSGSLAQTGIGIINSLFGDIGKNGNYKGSGISDTLGTVAQSVAQFVPELGAGMAITSVVSKVLGIKNFAGGAFGIGGNLIAGLLGFGKAKKGSATITDLSGNYSIKGNSGSAKDAAIGAADSVTAGLQRIVDALGGTVGAFSVSIGQRHGDYRVDTSGRGVTKKKHGAVDFDDDYEAAVRYAIMDAIQDGAIQGIRESTKRLLKAGKDLDQALEKALKFEDVFKRLRRLKDPIGAAVAELNVEFQNLIGIFKDAGASAEEWGQLQELYDLERADAIKQATSAAVQALDDFIRNMTSGADSPLSKRTVYENAKAEVDKFRSDIAAGKPIDQDALVTALENWEAASQEIFGSRGAFYADFKDIMDLATAARGNVDVDTTGANIPASPFAGLETTAADQLTEQRNINAWLARIFGVMNGSTGTGTGTSPGAGSTIDALPYYGSGGSSGGGDGRVLSY